MSTQLLRQGIRLRADARSRQPLLDFYTNATPQGWVRAATQFEIALASGGSLVDVTNLASVTIEAAPYMGKDGARVFSKTLAGSALDAGLTEGTWADGSRQHALFILTSGEMNIALPPGADRADFWLVVTALTTAGDPLVCGTGRLVLADDGTFDNAPPPPANPGAGITIDQADARYRRVSQGAGAYRPEIVALTGNTLAADGVTPTSLDAIPTANGALAPRDRVDVLLPAGTDRLRFFFLEPLAGRTADGTTVVAPADANPTTNNVAFIRY